ncbi:MAG: hypothetical protein ACREQ4_11590 [Candidatus Binataceae bacterium]
MSRVKLFFSSIGLSIVSARRGGQRRHRTIADKLAKAPCPASIRPAADQRSTMVALRQRLTRRPIPLTRLNRFSIRLVDDSTRSRLSLSPRRITVRVSSSPSRRRGGRAGMLMFELAREGFELTPRALGVTRRVGLMHCAACAPLVSDFSRGAVTIMWYDIVPAAEAGKQRDLVAGGQLTTTIDQVALAFTAPSNLPPPQVYENAIRAELHRP